MARAFLFVLDSVGVGGAPDAAAYGDAGADTLGHIHAAAARGAADGHGRSGPLALPNLHRLGLGAAHGLANGAPPLAPPGQGAVYGAAAEISRGKDTPSGHWEIAGAPVSFDWGYFPKTIPAFPAELTKALIEQADLPGILANRHASGIPVIEDFGEEHLRTGAPICYTSVDSVLQIAAHEEAFGLVRLYEVCEIARRLVDPYNIGRVIARPFVGAPGAFRRTPNRRDYATPPHEPTLLDRAQGAGRKTIAIGKIGDIFAHRGVDALLKGPDDMALFDHALEAIETAPDGALVFANFVEFDMLWGHRRDPAGYAMALERFDARIPELESRLGEGDLLILTADHGNDPTWAGTDHTRERVPIVMIAPGRAGPVGVRESFADIGASVAAWLGVDPGPHGRSFW